MRQNKTVTAILQSLVVKVEHIAKELRSKPKVRTMAFTEEMQKDGSVEKTAQISAGWCYTLEDISGIQERLDKAIAEYNYNKQYNDLLREDKK